MINDDIRFYDFDFNLLYILPQFSVKAGYTAINASVELLNCGSVEITFCDSRLNNIIKSNKDNILVIWRDFQGYITSYMFTDETNKLFGKHLNGLLKRVVIPTIKEYTTKRTAGYILNRYVLSDMSWLEAESGLKDKGKSITYGTEKYMSAESVIQEICTQADAGYNIRADIQGKKFIFCLITKSNNNLMLSMSNLNIYDTEVTYENTNKAIGGWYLNGGSTWTYISNDTTRSGIYKIDVVLSAATESEAKKELLTYTDDYKIAAKAQNIMHGQNYNIGDIIKLQIDGTTEKRLVIGINMWNEKSYGEEPILSEI